MPHAGRIGLLRVTVQSVSERFGNERSLPASTLPRREILDNRWSGLRVSIELRCSEPQWNELLDKSNGKPRWNGLRDKSSGKLR